MVYFKHKNKFIYWLVIPVFTILIIMGVFYVYINSENFRTNIKSILLTQLENSLGQKIEIGTIDSISFQSLQITGFIILEDNPTNEVILFQAERIKARFSFLYSLLHWKKWQLNIHEITFYQSSVNVTRDIDGEFDLLKKFDIEFGEDQQNLLIERINFRDSMLTLHDQLVYNHNQDVLTTQVVNIQGYLDLSQLPEIIFDFQGRHERNDALLALQGKLFINQPDYSLDFHLENADIMHFQYYLEAAEQFNITQGIFDLDLNLSFSPDLDSEDILWQGKANFQQINAKPSFLEEISVHDISGSVQFIKPEIKITELKGLYRNNTVSLTGLLWTEPQVFFDFDIESEKINISDLKDDISSLISGYSDFPLHGDIDMSGNVKGQPEDFQIKVQASSPKINIENIVLQNIDLDFSFNNNGLIVHSLNIHDSESSLNLSGLIDWSQDIPFYKFSLETEYLSLQSSLLNQFSLPEDVSGNLTGQFRIESAKEDSSIINIDGQFMANFLKTKEISLSEPLQGNIKSTVRLSNSIVSVHQGELVFMQNRAFLSGNIDYNDPVNFALDFACQVPELAEFTVSLGVNTKPAGRAEIKGAFAGQPENPKINAEIHLQEFSIQNYLLGEMTGKLVFQNNMITLEEFALTNQDIELTGNGDINLHESGSPEVDLFYQIDAVNIDSLMQTLDESFPLSGQLAGNGRVQGIWPALTLEGNFQLEQIIYDEYLLDKGQIIFNLQPEEIILTDNIDDNLLELLNWTGYSYSLELKKLELKNEKMELLMSGQTKLGEDNRFIGEIDFSHQAFNDMVEYFYPIDDDNLKMFLPSNITGKVKLEGNRYEQQIKLSTQLLPQQTQNITPSKLESVITRNQQGFTISDFHFIQPEGEFSAEGNIGFNQTLDIVFQAEELDINTLMSLAQIDEIMRGIININGSCKGTISQPEVSITAQIKEGYFREFQFADLQSDFYWDSKSNVIEINKFVIALEQDYQIQAKGNLPLDVFALTKQKETVPETFGQDIPLDFQIKMEKTDMKILRLFWKDVFSETTGNIDLEFNLTGTANKPSVNGMIDIHQGRVALDDFPLEIEELNTRIAVSDNKVAIPSIYFTVYENRFNISGQFELIDLVPENILITIRNDEHRIIYQNVIECEADLLAEIKGSLLETEIKGQLILSKGQLNLDQLQALNIEGGATKSSFTAPDALQGQFDMNVEIVDPFILKLPNAEIYVTGKIALTGSFTEPDIQGNIVLKKGYLRYFEKRFVISEGRVSIIGYTVKDVNINARAQTDVQDVQITIHVSGNLANPQIRLSSQPAMRETEIISLLALGRNIEGLSKGEIDQLLSQEMIDIVFQSLQQNIFKRMERELAEQLGLDLLRLSTENLITSDSQFPLLERMNLADLTLEVGKNIREDLFVTYKTPLGFQGEKSFSIDYQLSSDFTFNTQFDTYSLRDDDYRFQFGLKINF